MKIEILKSQNIELSKLEVNKGQIEGLPKNPRTIRNEKYEKLKKSIEDNPEMLGMREVLVFPHGSKYVIIGGNMRFQACKELQFETVPCKILNKDTTAEQLRAITIKDNVGFGEHDWELLANEWDSVELEEWGLEVPNFETEDTILEAEDDDKYTKKVDTPVYEPKNEKPEISVLYNADRYKELIQEIENSTAPEDVKTMLKVAASRHIVFNYENMADFYANSEKEVQTLMENSALVIIDFNRAIELGYVKLREEIAAQYGQDYGDEE